MKRLMILACLSATVLLLFSGCRHLPDTPAPNQQSDAQSTDKSGSYADLPVIYGEDGKVFVTLYENVAIPYRWVCMVSDSSVLRLIKDETVDAAGWLLVAGDSPSYHQFVLEWVSDGQATLTLENRRIPEYSDGTDDPAECRKFSVSRYGQEVFFEEIAVESDISERKSRLTLSHSIIQRSRSVFRNKAMQTRSRLRIARQARFVRRINNRRGSNYDCI